MDPEIDLECGEDARLLGGSSSDQLETSESPETANQTSDAPKKQRTRKASKPPRPPKGPLLDAVDQKLMREIAAVADRKRARIERIKTLKKMRNSKGSSCNSTLVALLITVFFCVVLVLQAFYSRNSGIVPPRLSPEPAVAGGGLISILNQSNSKGLVDQ